MKTTLNFDDRLLREAKKRAAEEGETLTSLIEKALRNYLRPVLKGRKGYRLKLVTKKGKPVPRVNWDDRESIYERMDGRT